MDATGQVDLKRMFTETQTIAVVGYSDKPERAGHYVAHYLAEQGYTVLAINPRFGEEINGLKCYPNLDAIPAEVTVDLVDVFRSPPHVPVVVEAAAKLNPQPKYIVLQPGAENPEASELARGHGITPVDACMMAAHRIWMPA